ncbi:Ig-like domain-containing protein [Hafnia alvei]|nr:Ig-like domain-containing protein [Hafnia alvei]QQE44508.1 Ig-like domain-containing protein [Hafnia alvei]
MQPDSLNVISSQVGSTLAEVSQHGVAESAQSTAGSFATNEMQSWLSQFGTASIELNVDNSGDWGNSAFDFLTPLYDSQQSMLFTQVGLRAPDGRTTGNMGMGVRTFYHKNWMFGGNVFFDDDFTGKNRRIGVGAEAWTDDLKLSANTYIGTTEWHQSRDFDDYNEKPADGFDLRVEGYLPAYPQLGAKLMYEQYYGDDVALFDKDNLQSNPSAMTTGINYTPIPLISMGIDYKRGQSAMSDTQFNLNLRYDIGRDWRDQISPTQVGVQRSLAGSRYDLVERNNAIVLAYQKKDLAKTLNDLRLNVSKNNSPADGISTDELSAQAVMSDGSPASGVNVHWSVSADAQLAASTSVTDSQGIANVGVTSKKAQQVLVQASVDTFSRSTSVMFSQSVNSVNLSLVKNNSKPDGTDENTGELVVKDFDGQAIDGAEVKWTVDHGASIVHQQSITDSHGKAVVGFTNVHAGEVRLNATVDAKSSSVVSQFSAASVGQVMASMLQDNQLANNSAEDTAHVVVKDSAGNLMPNVAVAWSLSDSTTAIITQQSTTTDAQGEAHVAVKNSAAGTVTITATAQGKSGSAVGTFEAIPVANVNVSMLINNQLADNSAEDTAHVVVKDSAGNLMPNVAVAWSLSDSTTAAITEQSTTTDAQGEAHVAVKNSAAGTVTITATAQGKSGATVGTFEAIPVASVNVSMLINNQLANNSAEDTAHVVVKDSAGNLMPNVAVAWSLSDSTTAAITQQSTTTDAQGEAHVAVKNSAAGTVTITATAQGKSGTTVGTFEAIPVASVNVSMLINNQLANNSAEDTAHVVVKDSAGNLMPNVAVAWSLSDSTTATITQQSTTTDAQGEAHVAVKNSAAGTVTITATAQGKSGATVGTFEAIPVASVNVSMLINNQLANNSAEDTAHVVVKDSAGNLMPNVAVAWSLSDSTTAAITQQSTTTDAQGEAHVAVKNSAAGTVTITATAQGKSGATVGTFEAIPVASVNVSMLINHQLANNSAEDTAHVVVKDSAGNLMPNVAVAWSLSDSSTATITQQSTTTDAQGEAHVAVKNSAAGSVTITATAGGKRGETQAIFAAVVKNVVVTATRTNREANNIDDDRAKVLVTDRDGNPVANQPVKWIIYSPTASILGSSTTQITDSKGEATVGVTDKVAESVKVTAEVQGVQGSNTVNFEPMVYGPVYVSVPEANPTITASDAANGTQVNAYYSGLLAGDQLFVTFYVQATTDDPNSHNYVSSVYTTTAADAASKSNTVILTVPASALQGIDSPQGGARAFTAKVQVTRPSTQSVIVGSAGGTIDTVE